MGLALPHCVGRGSVPMKILDGSTHHCGEIFLIHRKLVTLDDMLEDFLVWLDEILGKPLPLAKAIAVHTYQGLLELAGPHPCEVNQAPQFVNSNSLVNRVFLAGPLVDLLQQLDRPVGGLVIVVNHFINLGGDDVDIVDLFLVQTCKVAVSLDPVMRDAVRGVAMDGLAGDGTERMAI